MSEIKRAVQARTNIQFAHRLSIERCRGYISHMQALLHVGEGVTGEELTEALQQVIILLDMELTHSLKQLS
ncbi:MAG: hypothetical protein HYS17_04700 [Micavibrio aeruginosavorus]|uniref:Uncharacterized protein n=1 Tax=Micavibrio aeruginosavorus TaxID=349221 RepID=A0A7T5UIV0_9BACT|nr:MAG: hypothetical protein HYS17_04700 [Micavibrio aeruginosavorus]